MLICYSFIQHSNWFCVCVCVYLLFLFYKSHICVYMSQCKLYFFLDLGSFRVQHSLLLKCVTQVGFHLTNARQIQQSVLFDHLSILATHTAWLVHEHLELHFLKSVHLAICLL